MQPFEIKIHDTDKYQRLIPGPPDTLRIKSGRVILKSGETVGEHNTGTKEEVIIALEGEGEVLLKGKDTIPIEKYSVVFIPPETIHDVRNTGTGMLKYVFVVAT